MKVLGQQRHLQRARHKSCVLPHHSSCLSIFGEKKRLNGREPVQVAAQVGPKQSMQTASNSLSGPNTTTSVTLWASAAAQMSDHVGRAIGAIAHQPRTKARHIRALQLGPHHIVTEFAEACYTAEQMGLHHGETDEFNVGTSAFRYAGSSIFFYTLTGVRALTWDGTPTTVGGKRQGDSKRGDKTKEKEKERIQRVNSIAKTCRVRALCLWPSNWGQAWSEPGRSVVVRQTYK